MQAAPLGWSLGVPVDRAGRAPIRPDQTIEGHPALAFRYREEGTMATIGRSSAVADVWGMQLSRT